MKKYVVGIGLLLAALMFFGCKQPAEQKLGSLTKQQTVTLSKKVLDDTTTKYNFDSGWTPAGGEKVQVYAARTADVGGDTVSTLFNSAYYVDEAQKGKIEASKVKEVLGGAFYIGDSFNVGYRLVKTSNNEIIRSKIVVVNVVPADRLYVEVDKAELKYQNRTWQVVVTLKAFEERRASLQATLSLGGEGKATEAFGTKKAVVTASGGKYTATFTWDVSAEKVKAFKGVPLHAILTFTDIELAGVKDAKSEAIIPVEHSAVLNPEAPANADYEFKTGVVTPTGAVVEDVKLLEATDPVVSSVKPTIKIKNVLKDVVMDSATESLESVTYSYVFSKAKVEDISTIPPKDWQKTGEVKGQDPVNAIPTDDLEYNTTYYLYLKAAYVLKGIGKDVPATLKTVEVTDIKGPSFKTVDGLNAAGKKYDMKSAATTIFKPLSGSDVVYGLVGSQIDSKTKKPVILNMPAAVGTDADTKGGLLEFTKGKKISSYQSDARYSQGELTFKIRLPGKDGIKTMFKGASSTYLEDSEHKAALGSSKTNSEELWTLTLNNNGPKVSLRYYHPWLTASKKAAEIVAGTTWTYNPGKVCLVVEANGKNVDAADEASLASISEALFSTTGFKAKKGADGKDMEILKGTAPLTNVDSTENNGVLYDVNKWVEDKEISVTFKKGSVELKLGTASVKFERGAAKTNPVVLEKASHIDISDSGYSNFELKSNFVDMRIKELMYKVTK